MTCRTAGDRGDIVTAPAARPKRREDTHMTDRPPDPETGADRDMVYDRDSTPGTPRRMKTVGIIVAVLALLVIVLMLIGGGANHGR
jgi:hypothetical protein